MPISIVAPYDRSDDPPWTRHRRTAALGTAGFTLLEISLVLLLMVVVLAIVLPRLRDPGRSALEAQSHHLVLTFRWLRSEAVLNGVAYRLNYDLDQQRYWVTPVEPVDDLGEFARDIGSLARGTKLDSPVGIMDIVLPTLAGKVAQGQIYTIFYPDGSVDPTVIHLANGREAYTLWVNPSNGFRLHMDPGYHEVEYGT